MPNNSIPNIPPPPEKKFSIRTMHSDVKSSDRVGAFKYQTLEEKKQEIIQPIQPTSEISETSDNQPAPEIPKEKGQETIQPIQPIPEVSEAFDTQPVSEIPETPKPQPPLPKWAQEKLEEEMTQEPVAKKNLIVLIIVIATVIGFVFLGYFISFNIVFKH